MAIVIGPPGLNFLNQWIKIIFDEYSEMNILT